MDTMKTPLRIGTVFALTVGIGYALCAVVFWAWPQASVGFMNALFHGLDFAKLQSGPELFSFSGFAVALVGIMIWAFALGTIFGWLNSALSVLGGKDAKTGFHAHA